MQQRVTIEDIERIHPGESMSFVLPTGLACNTARSLVDYAKKTRGYDLAYSCDWKNLIVTITRLA